nr:unnamed protein product [Digitaria exilis]
MEQILERLLVFGEFEVPKMLPSDDAALSILLRLPVASHAAMSWRERACPRGFGCVAGARLPGPRLSGMGRGERRSYLWSSVGG